MPFYVPPIPSPAIGTSAEGLIATAGGGQANALQLVARHNRVTTVATTADSVQLPPARAEVRVHVANDGTSPLAVFPNGNDVIGAFPVSTSITVPAGNVVEVIGSGTVGKWDVLAPASVGVATSLNGTVGAITPSSGVFTTLSASAASTLQNATLTGSLFESATPGVTAFAGGGQASATQLTAQTNRVTTVATAGDSVKLPASVAGYEVTIINATNNPLQVFGAGTDTINAVAAATGITMPANSVDIFICAAIGFWHAEVGVGYSGSFFTESAKDSIVAFAGGGAASATLITAQTSRVATVGTIGDSIKLPVSAPGLELLIINHGVSAMQVFGAGTDTIDDVANATGVSQMANSLVIYTCATAGQWYTEGLSTGYAGGLQILQYSVALTATGTNQATALPLINLVNRVTTAALSTGVVLPAAAAGLAITVTNRGANPIAVYGASTDTVNGAASVAQMVNSITVYTCGFAGVWETDGVGQGFAGNFPTVSTTNGLTATAGGTQGTALTLTTVINRVTTVASAADAVKLPPSIAGILITVYNAAAANSLNVFPNTGDAINALAANTAFAVASGKNVTFGSPVAGQWHAVLSA